MQKNGNIPGLGNKPKENPVNLENIPSLDDVLNKEKENPNAKKENKKNKKGKASKAEDVHVELSNFIKN